MRPLIYGPETPRDMDAFAIDWATLVVEVEELPIDALPYLPAIAAYTNLEPASGAIAARTLRWREDPELARLLALVHGVSQLEKELVPRLLARTRARESLTAFAPDAATLERALREAELSYVSPFALEGVLAEYLYRYGMYTHYYEAHTANEAAGEARALLHATVGDNLEEIVPFQSRLPWGAWFDPHSCTDATFLLAQRARRRAWLFSFSHSD